MNLRAFEVEWLAGIPAEETRGYQPKLSRPKRPGARTRAELEAERWERRVEGLDKDVEAIRRWTVRYYRKMAEDLAGAGL